MFLWGHRDTLNFDSFPQEGVPKRSESENVRVLQYLLLVSAENSLKKSKKYTIEKNRFALPYFDFEALIHHDLLIKSASVWTKN